MEISCDSPNRFVTESWEGSQSKRPLADLPGPTDIQDKPVEYVTNGQAFYCCDLETESLRRRPQTTLPSGLRSVMFYLIWVGRIPPSSPRMYQFQAGSSILSPPWYSTPGYLSWNLYAWSRTAGKTYRHICYARDRVGSSDNTFRISFTKHRRMPPDEHRCAGSGRSP